MHARASGPEGGSQHGLQAAQDIIGIQHRGAAHLAQAIGTVAQNISERTGKHAHLTMKGNHSAETGGMVLICRFLFDEPIAVVAFFNEGQRRKGRKRRAEYHWPAAWPAAAGGSGKRLVRSEGRRVGKEGVSTGKSR